MIDITDIDLSNTRTALLALVDVVERVMGQKPRTAEIRKWLRSYTLVYPYPPIAAKEVQERIEELQKEEAVAANPWRSDGSVEGVKVLTTAPECGKL